MTQLEQLLADVHLPSPKGVALAVQALAKRETVTLDEIALVVQTDPALSGRLIKLANSVSQFSRPVASVQEAIVRQGVRTVCQLALAFSLIDQYRSGACAAFDYDRYWSHSLLMGLAMKELGTRVRVGATDELFICGLLAQIGQLGLATVYPEKYHAVLVAYQADPGHVLAVYERAQLQTDHIELGTAMMADWGIPGVFTKPVSLYENPDHPADAQDPRSSNLIMMLRAAHRLADIGLADRGKRPRLVHEWLMQAAKLGIETEAAGNLIHDVVNEWHDWGTLLQIYTEPLPDFGELLHAEGETASVASPLRVLLVDGNEFTRRKTVALLAETGSHVVDSVSDGPSAVAYVMKKVPDFVLVNVNLQHMDGLAVCRTLRETDAGRGLYILLMAAAVSEELLTLAYESGADGCVPTMIGSRGLRARLLAAQRMAHYRAMSGQAPAWQSKKE